jgi:hypothetical protein
VIKKLMGFFFFCLKTHFSTHSPKNTLEQKKKTILSIKKQPKTQNQTSEKLFLK